MSLTVLLSFEKPRFPNLISAETAVHLLNDMMSHKGSGTITEGQGVYGGEKEKCFQVALNPALGSGTQGALLVTLSQLARWAGQESILLLHSPSFYDILPESLQGVENPQVGEFIYVQQEDPRDPVPPRAWIELKEGAIGDHTLIGGRTFVLVPGC